MEVWEERKKKKKLECMLAAKKTPVHNSPWGLKAKSSFAAIKLASLQDKREVVNHTLSICISIN